MDLIRGYPEPHIAFLGLLLFSETHQGQGLGKLALTHIANLSRSWGCTALRLSVIDKNLQALAFWQREGFIEMYRKPTTQFTGDAIVMQRSL
jgi:GNAT superfamily N-acetyltransferase